MTSSSSPRLALVLSYSRIESDPRVRREIDWLTADGWTVDTLGLGSESASEAREHFTLAEPARWTTGRMGTLVSQTLLPARQRFRSLLVNRIPATLRERVREGAYDLIVFNEYEFAPWVEDEHDFSPAARRSLLHLDLHEFRNPGVRRKTLGGRLTGSHYRWVRRHIGSARFTSRTVVNEPIGRLYVDEFGFAQPVTVRNAPPYVDALEPQPVDPAEIRLLFHGLPSWRRGFAEILDSLETLPETFSMTFMLMPNPAVHAMLRERIAAHPAKDRIRIVPPAPMREIAQHINRYDLEIIFYKPYEPNLLYAMPNKFFEAAQGRIGIVVGETPTMAPLVREHGHGVVVPEFTAESLRDTLASLTAEQITEMKQQAMTVARLINADSEGRAFLGAINMAIGGRS